MKLPDNMVYTHHQGDISFCEVLRRPIVNGFVSGKLFRLKYERTVDQLPELTFENIFQFCVGTALTNPESQYQYIRYDNKRLTQETLNNEPFKASKDFKKEFDVYGYKWISEV